MQPPVSMSLKPGLERGLPWGRDLFTFVTSAAGHVMRILQKPRKKRPSKRQVNHRRFLHNMIQRKFADIEAANHRLASALFSTEQENKVLDQDQSHSTYRGASQTHPEADRVSGGDALKDTKTVSKSSSDFPRDSPDPTEGSEKNQSNSGHQWTALNHKCQSDIYTAISDQDKAVHRYSVRKKGSGDCNWLTEIPEHHTNVREERFQTGHCYYDHEDPPEATADNPRPPQSSLCWSWTECDSSSLSKIIPLSRHNNLDTCDSPSLSLELSLSLSPLSLESCDFSLQMPPDAPACSQPRKGQQRMDEMYPLESDVNDEDSAPCVEGYVDSIQCRYRSDGCTYWGGLGGTSTEEDSSCPEQPEICAEKVTMLVHRRIGHPASEMERSPEECRGGDYGYGGRDHRNMLGEISLCNQEQQGNSHCGMASVRQETAAIDFSSFESSTVHRKGGVVPNQLETTSETYHYNDDNSPETLPSSCMYQQAPQRGESCFMALDGGVGTPKKNVTFEGVAQSFSVPPQFSSRQRPVVSLPLEEDWLFTDILQDRKSPDLSNGWQ